MTDNFRWGATATAVSSVAHGGEALGAVTYLRRERFLTNQGLMDIPVISGNAWRGLLRRTAADLWWDAVGQPKLTLAVMHAIWAGGALAKSSGSPITGGRVQEVRQVCPVIGLFGASGGGRILDGALQVGKMIPVCVETRTVLPHSFQEDPSLPTLWDLTQIEYLSKFASVLEHRETVVDHDVETTDSLPPARFGVETFVAGTRFSTWLSGQWLNPIEMSFLLEVVQRYTSEARVGGYRRMGLGDLALEWSGMPDADDYPNWRDHISSVGADERSVLAWLD